MGKNKTETTQSSSTESNPWAPAMPFLENILNQADKLFNEQGGINKEWVDKEIADLTPEMQNMINQAINNPQFQEIAGTMKNAATAGAGGLAQGQGILGGLANQGITGDDINNLAGQLYDNELVDSQKANLSTAVQDTLAKNNQGINQRATASGGMGSSRAGIAEGVAAGKAADAMAQGTANIENAARQSAYGQALGTLQGNQNTALGAGGQLANSGLGALGVLGNLGNMHMNQINQGLGAAGIGQGHAQNVANNNWFNAQGQQNAGWDALSKYLGITGSIGGMGGQSSSTGTSSTSQSSNPFDQMLGLGSAALGAWMKSDAKMKKKIKKKGETKDGVGKYEWEWNDSAKKRLGKKGKEEGVLAQDVAKKKPEAVRKGMDGILEVNYDAIGVKNKKK